MQIFETPHSAQTHAAGLRAQGARIALVPTMGALHAGHAALMREARQSTAARGAQPDLVAVSIFVNPTQFGPNEDFERYPRTWEQDLALCRAQGVDWVFAPTPAAMYEGDYGVRVVVDEWGDRLCGASRPGHFRGVTTVVLKLLNICQPNAAFFGWKDAQQFLILRRMVRGLNVPVEMIGVETIREPDGLAISSRNRYLTETERAQAPAIHAGLAKAKQAAQEGRAKTGAEFIAIAEQEIARSTEGKIDYIQAVSMDRLEPVTQHEAGNTLLAAAVHFGKARLIDNVRF